MLDKIYNESITFPVLIGDIGGTNARFSILVDPYAEPKSFETVSTAAYPTIDEAIQAEILDKTAIMPRSAVLAVAGPVDGDQIDLTNCDWVVKPNAMMEGLGLSDVIVLNDFEAQALAVIGLDDEHLVQIGGEKPDMFGSRAVLGPGTGLGVAGLVHARNSWIPIPGEGGHVDVGPRSKRDFEIFPHLERIEGRISAEQLLCGRGLVNIYQAVCRTDKIKPSKTVPSEITDAQNDDAQCAEAIALFTTYLGRIAGDLALTFMARGGIYLAGGISQIMLPNFQSGAFRKEFNDKAPHGAFLEMVPVFVVTHPRAALVGLASFARTPQRFGVTIDGRRWRQSED